MESQGESSTATWSAPQCPFTIEYSSRVLDDIRLAVIDAFFSLPRGGAEIGGILLGSFTPGRLTIADYLALDCEHAFGPGFVLSPRDFTKLADLLASPGSHAAGLRPVGWYHSHTRTEIFLSDADHDIHTRYFPEPWQVALVLKPHTFQPTRAGFFFREAAGALYSEATYSEFSLDPLPVRPLPGVEHLEERPLVGRTEPPEIPGEAVTVSSSAVFEPPAATPVSDPEPRKVAKPEPTPKQPPAAVPPPRFLAQQEPQSRRWLKAVLAVAAGVVLGAVAYQTRGTWLPPVEALWRRPLAPVVQPTLGLTAVDEHGQMQIRWNSNSPLVRNGSNAVLEIVDAGPSPQPVALDETHLRSGSFTYLRESERVDVTLVLDEPAGHKVREATSFIGKLPLPPEPLLDPALVKERDDLTRTNAKLETDLKSEIDRRKKAEKSLADAREQLRVQRQRRLANQNDDR